MDKNLQNIDIILNDKFNNYQESPSDNVWEILQKNLDVNNLNKAKQKNIFQRKIIFLLLLLLGFSTTFYLYQSNYKNSNLENAKTNNDANEKLQIVNEKSNEFFNDSNKMANRNNKAVVEELSNQNVTNNNLPIVKNSKQTSNKNNEFIANTFLLNQYKENISRDRNENFKLTHKKIKTNNNNNNNSENTFETEKDIATTIPSRITNDDKGLITLSENNIPYSLADISLYNNTLGNKLSIPNLTKIHKPSKRKSNFSVTTFYNNSFYNNDIKEGKRRDLNDNDNYNNIREREPHRGKKSSIHQPSFGLLLSYNFKNNFQLSTGIGFANFKNDINTHTIYGRQNPNNGKNAFKLNCAAGTVYLDSKIISSSILNDSVIADATNINLQYFNIPIILGYKYSLKKLSISPIIGLQANFLSQGKLTTNISKGINKESITTNNIEGLKSIYFNSILGLKMDYKLLNNLSISIMPTINKGLNSINENTPAKTSYNGYGIATGLKFSF